jgi:hypothetical protein
MPTIVCIGRIVVMGNKVFHRFISYKEERILILGMDGSGKSIWLKRADRKPINPKLPYLPTIGIDRFLIATIHHAGLACCTDIK